VRYTAERGGPAQEEPDTVHLDRDKVVVRRRLRCGVPAVVSVPVSAYRGVAVRMVAVGEDAIQVVVELMHADPALSVPLSVAEDPEAIAADWQAWGETFGLPLLLVDLAGATRTIMATPGAAAPSPATARRAPAFLAGRRPRFLRRRKPGMPGVPERIEGREIIAPE
jgi:hypothetical protein